MDDGSTDASAEAAEKAGARVIRLGGNFGRGMARARAMEELDAEFVLCCDATVTLPEDFAERALGDFQNECVAAVFGRIIQPPGGNAVTRWRGRHLFKMESAHGASRPVNVFATWGAVVRRRAVMDCGNYDRRLRYAEDGDLGRRLVAAGWTVWFNADLAAVCSVKNSLGQALERYWRWHAAPGRQPKLADYLRDIWFSARVMAVADLRAGDPACALISLLCPHYRMVKSFLHVSPPAIKTGGSRG